MSRSSSKSLNSPVSQSKPVKFLDISLSLLPVITCAISLRYVLLSLRYFGIISIIVWFAIPLKGTGPFSILDKSIDVLRSVLIPNIFDIILVAEPNIPSSSDSRSPIRSSITGIKSLKDLSNDARASFVIFGIADFITDLRIRPIGFDVIISLCSRIMLAALPIIELSLISAIFCLIYSLYDWKLSPPFVPYILSADILEESYPLSLDLLIDICS